MANIYEQVKQALQDIVAPELQGIKIEIKRLDEKIDSVKNETLSEIKRLDSKIDSLDKSLNSRIDSLDSKINSLDKSLNSRIDSLDFKIDSLEREIHITSDIKERLAAVEGKVGLRMQ
ncbi:MAG: hypothetical protein M1135_02945 [Candidatus Omnitrophica bacterium]|nr:hypothetical protein [Candidatus Omnitrophota bacterium]